jgi:Fic family protein
MPKNIPDDELAAIETIMRERPEGVSMGDLVGAGAPETKRRAMQRRLRKLISLERVKSSGLNKSTRYFLASQRGPATLIHAEEANLEAEGGLFVPLSKEGLSLQSAIRRPLQERPTVGYRREFLSDYEPNRTFYLSHREREHLKTVGTVQTEIQPAGTYARHILDRLLIDLSFNSSRLEGNQYNRLDTIVLIEQGLQAEGKSAADAQMILNHKEAIHFLVENADDVGFNRHTILNLHGILANNLLDDPSAAGRLRRRRVDIGHSAYMPLENPDVIEECFAEILAKAAVINDPFEQAFFVSVQLPYLQAFEDVNKRVARLAANIPFIKGNLCPLSFIEVSEKTYVDALLAVYELDRTELARDIFVWAYERSARKYAAIQQSLGEPDKFRMRYSDSIRAIVADVIQRKLPKPAASKAISIWAGENVSPADRGRFIEVAAAELVGLHEGNFARYRVRPSEFFAWKAVWEAA